jgi:hypothetical protein
LRRGWCSSPAFSHHARDQWIANRRYLLPALALQDSKPDYDRAMKSATIIAHVPLGLMFVVFGSNLRLHFIPMPPSPANLAGDFSNPKSTVCWTSSSANRSRFGRTSANNAVACLLRRLL